jgi:adenylate kinase family enzyme
MIIGSGGAGKSTLSRQLGQILDLPVIHLDAIFWKPGWVATPGEEFAAKQTEALSSDEWIVDGNYGSTMDIRLNLCDTIIFLNFSRFICLYNVFKRYFQHRGKTRPDLTPGCPEKIDFEFVQWIWNFPEHTTPQIMEKLENISANKEVIILKNPGEIKEFIKNVPSRR